MIKIFDETSGFLSAPALTELSGKIDEVQDVYAKIDAGPELTAPNINTIKLDDAIGDANLNGVVFDKDITIVVANAANSLTLEDSTLSAGKTLTIDGAGSASILKVDASDETDGKLIITGGTADDILTGGAGKDILNGGAGADQLTGGAGSDTLTGGAGNDIFAYTAANQSTLGAMDTIEDYRANGDADVITISGVSAVASAALLNIQTANGGESLEDALNRFAGLNTTADGLIVFTLGTDTYAYIESANDTKFTAGDFVVRLTGTPFTASASVSGLGIDSV